MPPNPTGETDEKLLLQPSPVISVHSTSGSYEDPLALPVMAQNPTGETDEKLLLQHSPVIPDHSTSGSYEDPFALHVMQLK